MIRVIKVLGLTLITLLIMSFLTLYLLNHYVSPNQFKEKIAQKIMSRTGRVVVFNGDISWTLWPHPGVRAYDIMLPNPHSFAQGNLAEIYKLEVGIKILPLLNGEIEINNITILGARIALIKNQDGQMNWQKEQLVIKKAVVQQSPSLVSAERSHLAMPATKVSPAQQSAKLPHKALYEIPSVSIEAADISWEDQNKNQYYRLKDLNIDASHLQVNKFFPVFVEGELFRAKDDVSPTQISLALNAGFSSEDQRLTGQDVKLTVFIRHKKLAINSALTGNIELDMKKRLLRLKDIDGNISLLPFSANIEISNQHSKIAVTGDVHIAPFDLKSWIYSIGGGAKNLHKPENFSSDILFSDHHGSMRVDIHANLTDLMISHDESSALTNVKLQANYEDKVINIDSLSAAALDGTLLIKGSINLTSDMPQIAAKLNLDQLKVNRLNITRTKDMRLSGVSSLELEVRSAGRQGDVLLRNLSGSGRVMIMDGLLTGVMAPLLNNTTQANFSRLDGTMTIVKGIISNNDLYLDGTPLQVKGSGLINLPASLIDYTVSSTAPSPVTISLRGSLSNPDVVVS